MPTVSVIIPSYNCGLFIAEAIQSVLGQTYSDLELIVVDDGSTDDTEKIVSTFKDPRLVYYYQKNSGAGAARNLGIGKSRGTYLSFLDADDIWLPSKLELQMQVLAANSRAAVVYSDMYYFGDNSRNLTQTFFQLFQWPPPRGMILNQLVERSFVHPSVVILKREVIDKVGLFDETLKNCQDYDLIFRAAAHFEFEVVPVPLVKYRLHPGQISLHSDSVFTSHIAFFQKALSSQFINGVMRQRLRRRLAATHVNYSLHFIKKGKLIQASKELFSSFITDAFQSGKSIFSLLQKIPAKIFSDLHY